MRQLGARTTRARTKHTTEIKIGGGGERGWRPREFFPHPSHQKWNIRFGEITVVQWLNSEALRAMGGASCVPRVAVFAA